MFGLSVGEVIVILVIALLVLGPSKLPAVAKQLGKGMREFRRAASDLQRAFSDAADLEDKPKPTIPTPTTSRPPPAWAANALNEPPPPAPRAPSAPASQPPAPPKDEGPA